MPGSWVEEETADGEAPMSDIMVRLSRISIRSQNSHLQLSYALDRLISDLESGLSTAMNNSNQGDKILVEAWSLFNEMNLDDQALKREIISMKNHLKVSLKEAREIYRKTGEALLGIRNALEQKVDGFPRSNKVFSDGRGLATAIAEWSGHQDLYSMTSLLQELGGNEDGNKQARDLNDHNTVLNPLQQKSKSLVETHVFGENLLRAWIIEEIRQKEEWKRKYLELRTMVELELDNRVGEIE